MQKDEQELTKHTLNLYTGDYKKLQDFYAPDIGASVVIRKIVRSYIKQIEASGGSIDAKVEIKI